MVEFVLPIAVLAVLVSIAVGMASVAEENQAKQDEMRHMVDAYGGLVTDNLRLKEALRIAEASKPEFVATECASNRDGSVEYFTLIRFRGRYIWKTNLDVDPVLSEILRLTDSANVETKFVIHRLFRETRIGTNLKHKKNYDGSIDGGWFGLNSKVHPIWNLGDVIHQTSLFINYFNTNMRPYDNSTWNVRYEYGEKKAKELGLL